MIDEKNAMQRMELYEIPPHMYDGVCNYLFHGVMPGGFLTAMLSNDLFGAMARADRKNAEAIGRWCAFVYNEFPSQSWGSREAVEAWCKARMAEAAERDGAKGAGR